MIDMFVYLFTCLVVVVFLDQKSLRRGVGEEEATDDGLCSAARRGEGEQCAALQTTG